MCLRRIDYDQTKRLGRTPEKVVEAWKVFGVREGMLYAPFVGSHGKEDPLPECQWLAANDTQWIGGGRGMSYKAGWHGSIESYAEWVLWDQQQYTKNFPEGFVIRKVLFRAVTTVGRQYARQKDHRTWVAREMWICPGERTGKIGGRSVDVV